MEQPYGTWTSPLDAADLFGSAATPGDLAVDGDDLWWVESRPSEGGRQALVRWRDGEGAADVGPADWSCQTRVHEYGGMPFAVRDGVVVGAAKGDQRWWRLEDDEPIAVTPEPDVEAGLRFADAQFVPGRDALVAVRERHDADGGEPANELVLHELADGTDPAGTAVLVAGRDFVAAPRPSPDGRRLCWLAWDHPYMPWDAAELWVADLGDDGLSAPRHLAGGPDGSVVSPQWIGDDRLLYAHELDGWWRPVFEVLAGRDDDGTEVPGQRHAWYGSDDPDGDARSGDARIGDVEVGGPLWRLGAQDLAHLPDHRQAWVLTEQGRSRLALVTPVRGGPDLEDLDVPAVRLSHVRRWRDGVAYIGLEPDGTTTVSTWTPDDGVQDVRRIGVDGLRDGDRPDIRHVEVPTPDGDTTHAFVHLPANADMTGPDDERPPLLVSVHGGPTSHVSPVTTKAHAFWTTRGFAVADVNYRGSTGHGRVHREALLGRWGEVDVVDVMTVARHLADIGLVDGDRMAIRGGSAGGFTTLAALTTAGHPFTCGTSFYGVADLRALAEHTHKFESRYLDRLVGPLPEAAEVYAERSPLARIEQLAVPVLVLQGSEDRVVPPEQSRAIVEAAADNDVPHATIEFEGEAHGFRQLDSLVRWHEAELAFYGEVMGFTPAGDLPTVLNPDRPHGST